jgi:hypothetical protein
MEYNDIRTAAINVDSGYNEFQIEHFIIDGQYTDHRKLRQCLIEIESREALGRDYMFDFDEKSAQAEIHKENLEVLEGAHKKLEQVHLNRINYELSRKQYYIDNASKELKILYKFAAGFIDKYELALDDINDFINNEELDKEYWITRMGIQAAQDMLTSGRIQAGNLGSLMQMNNADRTEAIAGAISFTKNMEGGLNELQSKVEKIGDVDLRGLLPDINPKGLINKKMLE